MDDINNNIVKLSPPWYTFTNKIRYTYGLSDLVQVNDLLGLGNEYLLVINVFDDDVAFALRQVLPLNICFGNIKVNLVIFNTKGKVVNISNIKYTAESLNELFITALRGNPLFVKTVLTDEVVSGSLKNLIGDVVVVISKEVVQFYNDDISDLCSNYNEVASNVFKEITKEKFEGKVKVGFSTYDPDCKFQN